VGGGVKWEQSRKRFLHAVIAFHTAAMEVGNPQALPSEISDFFKFFVF
jgi:hypothetical protein